MIIGKRKVPALCTAVLMCGMIALGGCSKAGNAPETTNGANAGAASAADGTGSAQQPAKKDGKYDPPVTITTVTAVGEDVKFQPGDTYDNNVHTRWVKDHLGIDIQYQWAVKTGDDYNNKLKLMYAGNEKLPDVMVIGDDLILNNFIESGQLMDIKEQFNQYASQRMKDAYATDPTIWSKVERGDKIYGLPFTTGGSIPAGLVWYRQDWLDKYQLQVPTTMAEFEHVMDTFVKNGPKGTIGLTLGLNNPAGPASSWISSAIFLFAADGNFIPGQWNIADDGTLQYGSVQPSVKKALGTLAEWFKAGYLDPEVGSLDEVKALDSIAQEKSGILFGPDWTPGWPAFEAIPGFEEKFVAGLFPTGDDGRRIGLTSPTAGQEMVFSKDFKNFPAIMDYLDMFMAPYEEDSPFKFGYAEGVDYQMVDGKPNYTFDGFVDAQKYLLTGNTQTLPPGDQKLHDMEAVLAGKPPANGAQFKAIARIDQLRNQYEATALSQVLMDDPNLRTIKNAFAGAPTKTMVTRWDFLNKMELDTFTKIIYGQLPLDAFDKFVSDWKANGGDQITQEVNEWYQSQGK